MKKLFTLIALTCALAPAIHGMDTQLPTDVQQKYDNLTALIKNADADGFKPAFDAITLPPEYIAALRNTVAETKSVITTELEAMGDKTKNWSKIAKSGLATFLSGWAGLAPIATAMTFNSKSFHFKTFIVSLPITIPSCFLSEGIKKIRRLANLPRYYLNELPMHYKYGIFTVCSLACLSIAHKGLPYGIKTLKAGWNYKEYLQNMLANLDAIDAYITQAKA